MQLGGGVCGRSRPGRGGYRPGTVLDTARAGRAPSRSSGSGPTFVRQPPWGGTGGTRETAEKGHCVDYSLGTWGAASPDPVPGPCLLPLPISVELWSGITPYPSGGDARPLRSPTPQPDTGTSMGPGVQPREVSVHRDSTRREVLQTLVVAAVAHRPRLPVQSGPRRPGAPFQMDLKPSLPGARDSAEKMRGAVPGHGQSQLMPASTRWTSSPPSPCHRAPTRSTSSMRNQNQVLKYAKNGWLRPLDDLWQKFAEYNSVDFPDPCSIRIATRVSYS